MGSSPARPPSRSSPTSSFFLESCRLLYKRRETIRYLTLSEIKSGHRDKVLGHLWSILDPLLFMLIYYFVFGVLFKAISGSARPSSFMVYILTATVVFRFIEGTASQASTCIRSYRGLVHEINFPKAIFPISIMFTRLYDLLWGLLILVVFAFAVGIHPTVQYLWAPVLLLLTVIFATALSLLVAHVGAFFADTSNVVEIGMRMLLYLSPTFYFVRDRGGHHGQIQNETLRFWYFANPVAGFFECWRDALLWGLMPQPELLIYVSVFSVVLCLVAFHMFSKGEGRFAKYV